MTQYKFSIKRTIISITLLGEGTVGKTQLCNYFTEKKFEENDIFTVGFDIKTIEYKLKNDEKIKIKIWDTAGQERFRNMAFQYLNNTNGIIFVYDITNRESFNQLRNWIKNVKNKINLDEIPFIIFGNKLDLSEQRMVDSEEGKTLADKLSCSFYETSAKNGTNVDKAFDDIINKVYENKKEEFNDKTFFLEKNNKTKKECCKNKEKLKKEDL